MNLFLPSPLVLVRTLTFLSRPPDARRALFDERAKSDLDVKKLPYTPNVSCMLVFAVWRCPAYDNLVPSSGFKAFSSDSWCRAVEETVPDPPYWSPPCCELPPLIVFLFPPVFIAIASFAA